MRVSSYSKAGHDDAIPWHNAGTLVVLSALMQPATVDYTFSHSANTLNCFLFFKKNKIKRQQKQNKYRFYTVRRTNLCQQDVSKCVCVCVFKPPRGFNLVHYCLSFCWHFSSLNQSDIPCYLIQKCDYLQHKNSSWGQLGERSFFFRFCFSPFQDSVLTQFSVSSLVPIVFTNFFFSVSFYCWMLGYFESY